MKPYKCSLQRKLKKVKYTLPGTELLPNEHQRSQNTSHSEYLQASNKFLVKANDTFCHLVKKKIN